MMCLAETMLEGVVTIACELKAGHDGNHCFWLDARRRVLEWPNKAQRRPKLSPVRGDDAA